jgi:hypothetical protein
MTIDVATGIARILKQEGVDWVSTFPVCRVNNALGREGVPMLMMRDDRYAVAVADAFSRITAGRRIGVCTFQGGVNAAGMQYAYAGLAQAYEDGSPVLCITDGVPIGSSGNSQFDVPSSMKTVSKWFGYLDKPERVPTFMRRAFTMLRSGRPGPVLVAIPDATGTYDDTADLYLPVQGRGGIYVEVLHDTVLRLPPLMLRQRVRCSTPSKAAPSSRGYAGKSQPTSTLWWISCTNFRHSASTCVTWYRRLTSTRCRYWMRDRAPG